MEEPPHGRAPTWKSPDVLALQFLDEQGDFGHIRKNFFYRLLERIATLFHFTQLWRELHNIFLSFGAGLFRNMKSEQHLYAVVGENTVGGFHLVMVLVGLVALSLFIILWLLFGSLPAARRT
jgi:hypothetical protein